MTFNDILIKSIVQVAQLDKYSEVPIIRPPMVLVESGLNNEQVFLMRTILHWKIAFLVLKQVVLIARMVLM